MAVKNEEIQKVNKLKESLDSEYSGKTVTYIYTLKDPITNEIRYVGKANNISERYKAHRNSARDKKTHKRNWINSLKNKGLNPIMEILDVVHINEWPFWERYWLQQLKHWGFNLVNETSGGDGLTYGNKTTFKKGNSSWNKGTGKKLICELCGVEYKYHTGNRRFCSRECANINARNNPNSGTFKKGNPGRTKPIIQMDLLGNEIKLFNSVKEISIELKCTEVNIRNVCNGKSKTAKNFKFKYVKNMGKKIIILLSPSCGGKDTVARKLEKEHGFNFIVSTTTRPMRPGESEKDPYYFITNDEFEDLIVKDELIEYREYHTLVDNKPDIWYYGVEKSEVEDDKKYVVVLDTVGLSEFKEVFPDRVVSFYLEADDEIRKQRCLKRGDFNEYEWNRRLEDDKIRFSKEVIENEIDYVVESLDKDKTVEDIIYVLNNGK